MDDAQEVTYSPAGSRHRWTIAGAGAAGAAVAGVCAALGAGPVGAHGWSWAR